MAACPHRDASAEDLKVIRKKNAQAPQLLHVGEKDGDDWNDDSSLSELEGVTLVSPAAGAVVRLDSNKIYLDSCASHIQVFLEKHLTDWYETQVGLHTISNGGQNTACEIGWLLGALEAWLVRTWVANLLSIPELERKGFRVQSDTFADWVVTSPVGTKFLT